MIYIFASQKNNNQRESTKMCKNYLSASSREVFCRHIVSVLSRTVVGRVLIKRWVVHCVVHWCPFVCLQQGCVMRLTLLFIFRGLHLKLLAGSPFFERKSSRKLKCNSFSAIFYILGRLFLYMHCLLPHPIPFPFKTIYDHPWPRVQTQSSNLHRHRCSWIKILLVSNIAYLSLFLTPLDDRFLRS